MSEDPPRLLADLACHERTLPGHPPRDGKRRDGSHPHKAVFDDRIECHPRVFGAAADALDDVVGARAQRFSELPQLCGIDRRLLYRRAGR